MKKRITYPPTPLTAAEEDRKAAWLADIARPRTSADQLPEPQATPCPVNPAAVEAFKRQHGA